MYFSVFELYINEVTLTVSSMICFFYSTLCFSALSMMTDMAVNYYCCIGLHWLNIPQFIFQPTEVGWFLVFCYARNIFVYVHVNFSFYIFIFFTFKLIHESHCWVQRLQKGYAYVKLKTFLERKKTCSKHCAWI